MEKEDRLNEALSAPSTISTAETKRTRKRDLNIRTYYSSPEIRSRLDRLKAEWGVGESELTRWLLERALDLVDKGKLKPHIETVTKARLG